MCGRGKEEGTRLPHKQLVGRSSILRNQTRELFYLGVIREERTVGWHSRDVGDVLSCVPPYLILSAPTLHAAVALLGGWQGVGRNS